MTWKKDLAVYYEDSVTLGKTTLKAPITSPENLYPTFSVVLAGWSGKNEHRVVAMDEFYVFPIVLNDQIIQQNYAQIKGTKK